MAISAVGEQYLPARLRPFIFLSHPLERPSHSSTEPSSSVLWSRYYITGPNDFLLIIGWAVIITLLRWIIIRQLKKLAHRWLARADHLRSNDAPNGNGSTVLNANGATTAVMVNGNGVSNGTGLSSRKSLNGDVGSKVEKDAHAQLRHHKATKALKKVLKARERTATRFAEQGFAFIYYSLAWCCGLWVHRTIYDNVLDTNAFWIGHPHIPLPAPVKFYYLFAFTFYSTQTIILHIEEHRKDHLQMFTHHVITVLLIAGSYATHLTRVGCAILFILDWCDIFLALAKIFKYMDVPLMPDITFLVFLVSWLITRQILFPKIVWAVTFDMPVYLPLDWDPAINHLVTRRGWLFFAVSLWILQALLCIWFYMACKVLYNVIRGKAVEDSRSDDEGADADDVDKSEPSRSSSQEPHGVRE